MDFNHISNKLSEDRVKELKELYNNYHQLQTCYNYGLETVVSVLFTNTRTRWLHNEREIFNTARGVAECSIENFEFIVRPASACICKQNTN